MQVIGSRGSQLALWQAEHVKAELARRGVDCRIERIVTTGDRITHVPLREVGTKALFTKEIEEALLDGRVDLAVHSLKDMPAELPEGLYIAATPQREDARDALVGTSLAELPQGSRVGTGSLRRIAQLLHHRPDLIVQPMRGNVDTRLRKLDAGEHDAIVLAAAGLRRLGWENRIAEYLPVELMCPAVGQGALAIETRRNGGTGEAAALLLEDVSTRAAITAERALLSELGAGCQVPMGAHATVSESGLHLRAVVISLDGQRVVRDQIAGAASAATQLGSELGRRLLANGGRAILDEVYGSW